MIEFGEKTEDFLFIFLSIMANRMEVVWPRRLQGLLSIESSIAKVLLLGGAAVVAAVIAVASGIVFHRNGILALHVWGHFSDIILPHYATQMG